MAPGMKRKRGDRQDSYESKGPRQSPYRPEESQHAQYGRRQSQQGHPGQHGSSYQEAQYQGRGRRGPRGGRGGYQGQQSNGAQTHSNGPPQAQDQKTDDKIDGLAPAAHPPTTDASSPAPPVMSPTDAPQAPLKTTTPAPPIARPLTEPPPPQEPPAPFLYEVLTEETIQSWEESGRASILASAVEAFSVDEGLNADTIFQEIIRAGRDAKLPALEAGKLITDVIEALPEERREEAASTFLDSLTIIDEALEPDATNPRLNAIAFSTGISPHQMRLELETSLLKKLGLVRSTFHQVFIRKQTNLLYKQSNYNLLREESEGYSKLITELFTTTQSQPPKAEVIEETFENMKALIGAFDLDAGRVLDITLDVFANLLVRNFRFFVRLLRQSSWWPEEQKTNTLHLDDESYDSLPPWAHPGYPDYLTKAEDLARLASKKEKRDTTFWDRAREVGFDAFFELGGRRVDPNKDIEGAMKAVAEDEDKERASETRRWITDTKTLPPPGNSTAAQFLGFKLKYYTSNARDPNEKLPDNLIYLIGLLIKIGFISLKDMYPHLWPGDEAMGDAKDKKMKEQEEREQAKRPGGGAMNALSRAGALADDTLPPSGVSRLRDQPSTRAATPSKDEAAAKPEADAKDQLPEAQDQKIELLKSLLLLGALPEALYMIGRFPWVVDAFPELAKYVHRLLHHSLSKVYQPVCPLTERDGIREAAKIPTPEQAGAAKGELSFNDRPPPKVLKWAQLDRKDVDGTDREFYWSEWSDNVPICQDVDDMFTLCGTLLNLSGAKIGRDPMLMTKLARIGKKSLSDDESDSNRKRWIDLCKRLLVPALSLTGCNPGVVNEVFDLLKLFDTSTRYAVYSEWFLGPTSRLPDIASAFDLAKAETKDTMKRMSKTNMRPMARQLAKVACASPGVVFQAVFHQIESYNNLIDVVVECGRYFTYMSYDVLTWALLMALGRAGRTRVSQTTGTSISLWLQSLSTFTGKVFKRYSVMNPQPILQYILEQLKQDNFSDLQVLKELSVNMGGISADTDFTESQVQAMAGGELLQAQTLKQVHDKRHENRTSGKRLTKALVDHDLVAPMLISIAQTRDMVIFNSHENQVKVVSENFDSVHIILQQFLDLIRQNLSTKDFDHLVPDVASLIDDYNMEPNVAFMIHRKGIAKAIEEYDTAHPASPKKQSFTAHTSGDDGTTNHGTSALLTSSSAIEDQEMSDATEIKPDEPSDDAKPQTGTVANEDAQDQQTSATLDHVVSEGPRTWHPVLEDLIERLKTALPADLVESMSMPFYVSFWQLSINDLALHNKSYQDEEKRQKDKINAISSDREYSGSGSRKKEADRTREFIANLLDEMKTQIATHTKTRKRLEKEKAHWFDDFLERKDLSLTNALLQECFLPRMLMSPLDSYFCWRMLNLTHSSGTPGFRTMHFIDALMNQNRLANIMFQCTGREADNLGRFLHELLKELGTWHADKAEYEKRAYGPKKNLPGFVQKWDEDGMPKKWLDYEDFRALLYKWHCGLQKAAKSCIDSGEYMHLNNACIVLKGVQRVYPRINWMGKQLCTSLEPYMKGPKEGGTELRNDVRVLTSSTNGFLRSREKSWVLPQAFRRGSANEETQKQQKEQSQPASQAPRSPQPTLNAQAPDFQPNGAKTDTDTATATAALNGTVDAGASNNVAGANSDDASVTQNQTAKQSDPNAATMTETPGHQHMRDSPQNQDEMRQRVIASTNRRQPRLSESTPRAEGYPSQGPATPSGQVNDNAPTRSSRPATPASQNQAPPHGPSRPDQDLGRAPPNLPNRPTTRQNQDSTRGRYDRRDFSTSMDRSNDMFQQRTNDRGGLPNGVAQGRFDGSSRYRDGTSDARSSRDMPNGRYEGQAQPPFDDRAQRPDFPQQGPPVAATSDLAEVGMNPARAALLAGREEPSRNNYGQAPSEPERGSHGGRGSRAQSPSRGSYDKYRALPFPDDRSAASGRGGPPMDARGPGPRDYATDQAPNGPRGSAGARPPYPNDLPPRPAEAMRPPPTRPERGARPFQDTSRPPPRYQDESYGRLTADNSFPVSPAQSPPTRQVNGTPTQPQHGGRQNYGPPQPTQPPVSPAKDRFGHQRQVSAQAPTASPASSNDRPPSAGAETGIHPSRLANIEQPSAQSVRPPPLQTQPPQPYHPSAGSPNTSHPPSGPRSATLRGAADIPPNSPAGPRNGAPAGPSDRRSSNQPDRRFAGLQDTVSGRGGGPGSAAAMRNGAPPSGPGAGPPAAAPAPADLGMCIRGSAMGGPPGPQQQQQMQQPPPPQYPGQASQQQQQISPTDLFANKTRGHLPPQESLHQPPSRHETASNDRRDRDRDRSGRGDDRNDIDRDRDRGDRRHDRDRDRLDPNSGRGSHRSSREASRNPERDPRDGRDHRERKDDRAPRDDLRAGPAGPVGAGGPGLGGVPGADAGRDGDRRLRDRDSRDGRDLRGQGRGPRYDDGRGGGGGGGDAQRRNPSADMGNAGRKREYEGGREGRMGVDAGGSVKRPRRNGGPGGGGR